MSDYLELVEEARDAMRALLRRTEPGTGLTLHYAFASLEKMIKAEQKEQDEDLRRADGINFDPELKARIAATERKPKWVKEFTVREREHELLGILGEHRLTQQEMLTHLREKHSDLDVWHSNVVSVVARLYKRRDLDRAKERARNGGPLYRYFRRTVLDGPIADLQRAFDEEAS